MCINTRSQGQDCGHINNNWHRCPKWAGKIPECPDVETKPIKVISSCRRCKNKMSAAIRKQQQNASLRQDEPATAFFHSAHQDNEGLLRRVEQRDASTRQTEHQISNPQTPAMTEPAHKNEVTAPEHGLQIPQILTNSGYLGTVPGVNFFNRKYSSPYLSMNSDAEAPCTGGMKLSRTGEQELSFMRGGVAPVAQMLGGQGIYPEEESLSTQRNRAPIAQMLNDHEINPNKESLAAQRDQAPVTELITDGGIFPGEKSLLTEPSQAPAVHMLSGQDTHPGKNMFFNRRRQPRVISDHNFYPEEVSFSAQPADEASAPYYLTSRDFCNDDKDQKPSPKVIPIAIEPSVIKDETIFRPPGWVEPRSPPKQLFPIFAPKAELQHKTADEKNNHEAGGNSKIGGGERKSEVDGNNKAVGVKRKSEVNGNNKAVGVKRKSEAEVNNNFPEGKSKSEAQGNIKPGGKSNVGKSEVKLLSPSHSDNTIDDLLLTSSTD